MNRFAFQLSVFIACIFLSLSVFSQSEETTSKDVFLILAYDGDAWYPYLQTIESNEGISSKGWKKLKGIKNPALVTRQPETGKLFFKAEGGVIYSSAHDGKNIEAVLPEAEYKNRSFTQLHAAERGLYLVELVDGKSSDTHLLYLDDGEKAPTVLVNQVGPQFNPYAEKHELFYSHVSCRVDCGHLIQEVWSRDLRLKYAKQLTLLNGISSVHSVSDNYLFISSNANGNYHLARIERASGEVEWLTEGDAVESYPSVSKKGDLYFIQRNAEGTQLKKITSITGDLDTLQVVSVAMPDEIKKLRYLEITQ